MSMYQILEQLSSTNSRKDKEAILSNLSKDQAELFKFVSFLTYDPSIDYYVKEFDSATEFVPSITLADALTDLKNSIASRVFTGNLARSWIQNTQSLLTEEDAIVFERVIKGDLKCGVSAKTINKIWPGTIYEHPYMRCSSFTEKSLSNISYPCWSQTKMDGLYVDIIVYDDKVEYRTRNGSLLDLNDEDFDQSIMLHFNNKVIMGEAIAIDCNGEDLDRQTSNGYLNSNNINPEQVKFYVWDMITLNEFENKLSKTPYMDRFNLLSNISGFLDNQRIATVDTILCLCKEDIIYHFKEMRLQGKEGTVIKNQSTLNWKPGTSKHQIKCKVIFDCDLKVVGWKKGQGRHEGKLGAIICQSSDGLLEVSVGTGFKDSDRAKFLDCIDDWISEGKIVTVRANDVVTNQSDPNKYSLFLGRFVEVRNDKDEADSLERILEQVKAFTNALDMIK